MLNAQKTYYIGLPTIVDNRNVEDFDNCRKCLDELGDPTVREERNNTLGIQTPPMHEECPECVPQRSTATVYIAVSNPHPLISEFYEHPEGIMANIRGMNSIFYLSLKDFLHKFRKYVEILPDDDTFEDELKSHLDGSERQSMIVEQIIPEFIHDNWDNTTRREQQLMGIVAINAISVMDSHINVLHNEYEKRIKDYEEGNTSPGSEGGDSGSPELQERTSTDIQEG